MSSREAKETRCSWPILVESTRAGSGDGLLAGGVDLLALGHAGLRQGRGGDGAAVDLAQGAAAVQGSQVAADRLRGDVEVLGELGDEDPPRTAHLLHDLAVPVLDAHVHPLTPVSTTDHVRSGIISILNV